MLELIFLLVNLCLAAFKWPIYPRFLFILLAGVVCSFCEKDFVSLGRHAWRCKQRIHRVERHNDGEKQLPNDHDPVADTASRVCFTKCCCGKLCKGNR